MKIQESAENYLEVILVLQRRICNVRSVDIANELGFSKPSVSVAMKKLRENGYINFDKDGYVTLNDSGLAIAKNIYARHRSLTEFLVGIGVDAQTASEDACKIEHHISQQTFEKLKEHINKCKDEQLAKEAD